MFSFKTQNLKNFLSNTLSTKRYLLQTVGHAFDPIGFIIPYYIKIKYLIQDTWCLALDWDENLPKYLETLWNEWFEKIKGLNCINIPRYYLVDTASNEDNYLELYSF